MKQGILNRWKCPRCPWAFIHARYLVRHLSDVHNQGVAG